MADIGLRPLAELNDEYGTLAVVAADNSGARIHLVNVEQSSIEASARGDVKSSPETCQQCGSSDVFRLDLINELVRQAEVTSADVDFADPTPGLTEEDGVAALLRF